MAAGRHKWQRHITLVALILSIGVVLSALFIPLFSQGENLAGRTIQAVEFVGLRNVTADELYPLIYSRIGEPLQPENFNNDLKALFGTGYFGNVEMRLRPNANETVDIVFIVEELPRISDIEFLGADELPLQEVKSVLSFVQGDVYSPQKVKEGVALIKARYREDGYFFAEVWYRTGELDPETNQLQITYIIDEGDDIPISRINILGTRHLDAEDILDILEQKEVGFFDEGKFQESLFEEDKLKILAYAKSNGYVDAEIDPRATGYEIRWRNPDKPEDGRVVIITYKLVEGDIRFFGGYSVEHNPNAMNLELNPPEREIDGPEDLSPIYKPETLLGSLEFIDADIGEVFDERRYFQDRGFMQEMYSREGYVYAQIRPEFVNFELTEESLNRFESCLAMESPAGEDDSRCKKHAEYLNLTALRDYLEDNPEAEGHVLRHIHFTVSENNLAYIENIILKGMEKTQEYVIRRELLIKEGQLFNSALVNRSREKLINLGYFKEVNLQMRPGSSDEQMNLIMEVKEQPTGTISIGGGYGTQSGFSIFTEVGDRNLNGTGQRLSGRLEYGPLRRAVSIDWTEPWFYEACQDSTGWFWRNKLKEINNAPDLTTLEKIADTFQNNYSEIGKVMKSYVVEAETVDPARRLDYVKARIRVLIDDYVAKEYECYRQYPRPWSLRLGAFYSSSVFTNISPLRISLDANDLFENASYERNRFGLSIGTQHTFLLNWAHYHVYSPSWAIASRPSALANNAVFREVDLGWQFKSSLRNGLIYSTIDNVFTPTEGLEVNLEVENVGQVLGGDDHFNRYTASTKYYWWWFDFTFGGFFRRNVLRRWRVVQEFRLYGIFSHETVPYGRDQDPEKNPYMEPEDRQYLGGTTILRGYDQVDSLYPAVWQDGGNHMIFGGTELRIPIEPTIVWFAVFFDWGTLFDNLGEYTGDLQDDADSYEQTQRLSNANTDPLLAYLADRYDPFSFFTQPYHYESQTDWNNPKRAVLSQRNLALDRALYSWGFGLRIQIPVLPLRLFLAQKLYYKGNGVFAPIPGNEEFEFVFGIGDQRF